MQGRGAENATFVGIRLPNKYAALLKNKTVKCNELLNLNSLEKILSFIIYKISRGYFLKEILTKIQYIKKTFSRKDFTVALIVDLNIVDIFSSIILLFFSHCF